MAKAFIKRPDGTEITIEGSAEEIKQVLGIYQGTPKSSPRRKPTKEKKKDSGAFEGGRDDRIDHAEIVNIITSCDEAEAIDDKVLKSNGRTNRVMLPLYIEYKYLDEDVRLTTSDIEKITSILRVKVLKSNTSTCLSGPARKYVEIDKTPQKGIAVGYRINRRGITYFEGVLAGSSGD